MEAASQPLSWCYYSLINHHSLSQFILAFHYNTIRSRSIRCSFTLVATFSQPCMQYSRDRFVLTPRHGPLFVNYLSFYRQLLKKLIKTSRYGPKID